MYAHDQYVNYFQLLISPNWSCWRSEDWRDAQDAQDVIFSGFLGVFFTNNIFRYWYIRHRTAEARVGRCQRDGRSFFFDQKKGSEKKRWKKVFSSQKEKMEEGAATKMVSICPLQQASDKSPSSINITHVNGYMYWSPQIQCDAVMFVSYWICGGQSNRIWTVGTLSSKVEVSSVSLKNCNFLCKLQKNTFYLEYFPVIVNCRTRFWPLQTKTGQDLLCSSINVENIYI